MIYERVNELLEEFYKSLYEIEALSLKRGIKNLTTTELHVIEAIGHDDLSMNELSEKLGITMGTATVAVNKLLKKEFLNRVRCSHDRRKVYVSLTEKGLSALDYHKNFHKNIISEITKNISEEELVKFTDVFEKVLANINGMTELVNPTQLSDINSNCEVEICEIKGSSAVKAFFFSVGIMEGTILRVINKTDNSIRVSYKDREREIDILDAKNIFAVKKDIH